MSWKAKYPFNKMSASQEVFIDGAVNSGPEAAAARKYFKRCGARYSVRQKDGGIVVKMLSDRVERDKPRKRRKPQSFAGHRPNGDQWHMVGEYKSDGSEWEVWSTDAGESGWANVKVCAKDKAIRKANYWLGWNGERLAKNGGLNLLLTGRPQMVDKIVAVLKGD